MIDAQFIAEFDKPFWLLNTARGKSVVTGHLVSALKNGKILGAGLDVLEYENLSFESLFTSQQIASSADDIDIPPALEELLKMDNVILSPHIAGWSVESKIKLAQTIVDKITAEFS